MLIRDNGSFSAFLPPIHTCAHHCKCLLFVSWPPVYKIQPFLSTSSRDFSLMTHYHLDSILLSDMSSSVMPWTWQCPFFHLVIALHIIFLKRRSQEPSQGKSPSPLSLLFNSAEQIGHSIVLRTLWKVLYLTDLSSASPFQTVDSLSVET